MSYLSELVRHKAKELGNEQAAEFFGVGEPLIKQWQAGTKPVSLSAVEKVFSPEREVHLANFEEASWEGKKVAILLPWYKEANPLTAFCVAGLLDRAKMSCILNFGDAMVSHTRNLLANQFIKSGIEWSFSIDSDMIVGWGNAGWYNKHTGFNFPEKFAGLHAINRLLSHKKTIIGMLYFGRQSAGRPMYAEACNNAAEAEYARTAPHDLIKPTRWVATGGLLVHRSVFLDIQAKFPELAPNDPRPGGWYSPSEHDLVVASKQAMEVLNDSSASAEARVDKARKILHEGQAMANHNARLGIGEDVIFSHRAMAAGHQPYVDMGCVAGHVGSACYGPSNTGIKP